MNLSFRRLTLCAILSFCLSVGDVHPETGVPITSFPPISAFVEVCSTSIVGVSSSRFLLAKHWFSSSLCFPFRLKNVTD